MKHVVLAALCLAACKRAAGPSFFGDKPVPPGILAQVTPGMTVDELKHLVPTATNEPLDGWLLAQPAPNVKLYAVEIDGVIVEPYVKFSGDDGIEVLTKAWGAPDQEHDRMDHDRVAWRNPSVGYRATAECGKGHGCSIAYYPYKPLEDMLGKAIVPPGDMAKARPGMSDKQLAAITAIPKDGLRTRDLAYDGASESMSVIDGKLFKLDYTLPALAKPMIEKAWGPGIVENKDHVYYDAADGSMATVVDRGETVDIEFGGYQPFAAQVDLFEKLAAAPTREAAKDQHPELVWDRDSSGILNLTLMPNEYSPDIVKLGHTQQVGVYGRAGPAQVTELLDLDRLDQITAELTKRWGAPVEDKHVDKDQRHVVWPTHASLLIGSDDPTVGFEVSRSSAVYK